MHLLFFPDNNGHVNNLLNSTTKDTEGWNIDIESGKWKLPTLFQTVDEVCGPEWWGFSSGSGVGTISTMLNRSTKCGRLDFGNCWDTGVVRVYLEGVLIWRATANTPSQIISFPLPQDSLLEIKDEGANSVIKFNQFEMVQCSTGERLKQAQNCFKIAFFIFF